MQGESETFLVFFGEYVAPGESETFLVFFGEYVAQGESETFLVIFGEYVVQGESESFLVFFGGYVAQGESETFLVFFGEYVAQGESETFLVFFGEYVAQGESESFLVFFGEYVVQGESESFLVFFGGYVAQGESETFLVFFGEYVAQGESETFLVFFGEYVAQGESETFGLWVPVTFGHNPPVPSPFPSRETTELGYPGRCRRQPPATHGPCSGPLVAKSLVYGPGPGSSWGDQASSPPWFNTYSRGSTHLGAAGRKHTGPVPVHSWQRAWFMAWALDLRGETGLRHRPGLILTLAVPHTWAPPGPRQVFFYRSAL